MSDTSPSADGEVFPSQGSQDHAWRLVGFEEHRPYVQCSKCGVIESWKFRELHEYDGWGESCE